MSAGGFRRKGARECLSESGEDGEERLDEELGDREEVLLDVVEAVLMVGETSADSDGSVVVSVRV